MVDPTWALRASANFDRANGIDLGYQHTTTHQLYMFFMSGTTIIGDSSLNPSSIASGWTMVGGR